MSLELWQRFYETEEATVRHLKAQLATGIIQHHRDTKQTQVLLAQRLGVSEPRVSNLLRGQLDKFTVDMLLRFQVRLGLKPAIQ